MTLTFTTEADIPASAEALGVPVGAGLELPEGAGVELNESFLTDCGFEGKVGQTQAMLADDGTMVVAVGVGPLAEVDADALRRAGAAFGRSIGAVEHAATTLHRAGEGMAQAVVEGIALGRYRYAGRRHHGPPVRLRTVALPGARAGEVKRGEVVARAVCRARDWVNEPPATMTPRRLAEVAAEAGTATGSVEVEVWDEGRIASERLGGLLGVSAGAAEPPRVIQLRYRPARPEGSVALVGKGITFDSGGLSLKTADGMMTMKSDMGGAAAVLSALAALPELGCPVEVTAYVCATENMPSGTAIHPGDVLTARDGTTIEVLNTDAEGRLVLADALALAVESPADAIIDVATLTGAQRIALGDEVAAVMSNDDVLAGALEAAGGRAGEPLWRLPLHAGYRSHLDSEVADLRNIGKPSLAGTIVAGLFLQEFVAGRRWAHLDIAAPSFVDAPSGWRTKGATGWGVATLLELLREPASLLG